MNGKKLAQSKASFVVFRWAVVGVETDIRIGSRFCGAECLVEVGRFAVVSVGGVVFGRGQQSSQKVSPAVAMVEGHSLVSGGGRQRRFMATGLMARTAWANAPSPSTAG